MNQQLMEMFQQNMMQGDGAPGNQQMMMLMNDILSKRNTASNTRIRPPSAQFKKLKTSRNRWKRYASGLADSVNYFAQLLGACPVCFSNDQHCRICEGSAMGEYSEPNIDALLQLVAPIFEQAGLVVVQNVPEEVTHIEKEK